jgi:hypothetical protein
MDPDCLRQNFQLLLALKVTFCGKIIKIKVIAIVKKKRPT